MKKRSECTCICHEGKALHCFPCCEPDVAGGQVSSWATRDLPRPNAFVQWKGTDVCMDCYCTCGEQFHIDSDFAYAVQCRHCGKRFEMSAIVEMRELAPDEKWEGCPIRIEVVDWEDGCSCSSHTEPLREGK